MEGGRPGFQQTLTTKAPSGPGGTVRDEARFSPSSPRLPRTHARLEADQLGPELQFYHFMTLTKLLSPYPHTQSWALMETRSSNLPGGSEDQVTSWRMQALSAAPDTQSLGSKPTVTTHHIPAPGSVSFLALAGVA